MPFNLKKTAAFQPIRWERNPLFRFRRLLKILFFIAGLALLALFAAGISNKDVSDETLEKLLGGTLLILALAILFWEIDLFFNLRFKNPRLNYSPRELILQPTNFNAASFLDYQATKIFLETTRFAKRKQVSDSLSTVFLYCLISSRAREINFVAKRTGLNFNQLKKELKKELSKEKQIKKKKQQWEGEWKKEREEKREKQERKQRIEMQFCDVVSEAAKIADKRKREKISPGELLVAVARLDSFFKRFLVQNDIRQEDIEDLVFWQKRLQDQVVKKKRFWDYNNLLQKGFLAKDWAAGFTITLDKYSLDLREKVGTSGFREIIGHKEEIKRVERILEKKEINNVLLVGQPGAGRDSIVEALAQRAFFSKSSENINFKRILKFDITSLTAEITSSEMQEAILDKCFQEAVKAGNIILVIDEFHNFVSDIPKPGVVDISGILGRYLALSDFQIIAVTTYDGLHSIIEKNPSLNNLFEKVEVKEISEKETLHLLENYVPFFEKKHKKFINYKALREVLTLSSRYLTQTPFPEKALRLLDEAMSYLAVYTKDYVLREEHIKKVITEKTEIPVEELEAKEKKVLLNLEKLIHQRIINQEEAVKQTASALRRARAEVSLRKGPIGTFLFLGPTGVGKTETSKALSSIYFGSEKRMIRLDMSEFQNLEDIKRLIGSQHESGLLTTPVRENPFSLVLLDEIEKAHVKILNLFLQVLDEGWLTDGMGRKVDFKNTIIIATSNAGAEIIRQDIQADKALNIIKDDLLDYLFREKVFRPEFINRFDAVIVFRPLTKENLLDIAHLMLDKLARNLQDKGIRFEITLPLKQKIAELGYNPVFGAREMKRVLQDKVENVLANAILSGKLKRGKRVEVDPTNFELIINPINVDM